MLLYALTVFVSAFLLFQVQPIIARLILPWFGGSAAVWTTCMLFFQVLLLLGYLYAHCSIRYLRPRTQKLLHLGLLGLSLLSLPILPRESWKPLGTEEPTFRILCLLLVTLGLPYFLLSTTGPLLQAWYATQVGEEAEETEGGQRRKALPYRLYALSNFGSMLALLGYPVLVEPVLGTRQQAVSWSAAYGLFAVLCAAVALRSWRLAGATPETHLRPEAGKRPGMGMHLAWVALAGCSCTLLLAATSHLTQNIAPIPFLWLLPLSLYLLSFIIPFGPRSWRWHWSFYLLPPLAFAGLAWGLAGDQAHAKAQILIPLFAGCLFICCLLCHGELARRKPDPRYLTSFYLMISLGGALGGIFVGLLAPRLFSGYYEFPLGIALCALLAAFLLYFNPSRGWRDPVWIGSVGVALVLIWQLGTQVKKGASDYHFRARNFYGVLKVADSGDADEEGALRTLTNGTIDHGEQFLDPARRKEPISYYGPESGVGLAIKVRQKRPRARVGVIGLGTGTLAAYARAGDTFEIFEINPRVRQIADTEFTYVPDARARGARVDVVMGDARLSLERSPAQNFDVLAVDAFTSDSIPVHLLTKEAIALYWRHLKPDGILAVHVSNRYLDLAPIVLLAAQGLGKAALEVDSEEDEGISRASWVLVAANRKLLDAAPIGASTTTITSRPGLRMWTDDYSNLFQILER